MNKTKYFRLQLHDSNTGRLLEGNLKTARRLFEDLFKTASRPLKDLRMVDIESAKEKPNIEFQAV